MKKIFALVLVLLLTLCVFAGCQNEKNVDNADGERISSAIFEENSGEGEVISEVPDESESEPENHQPETDEKEEDAESVGSHESEIFLESGTGVEIKKEPEIVVEEGITYVDGILIANKTYALPSSYAPGDLLPEVYEAFYELQAAARSDGLSIYISSGYRSYDLQSSLYSRYCARDGQAAADRYSARPGHSEHQTGLAMDVNEISDAFIGTPEAIWLQDHAHEYGFIIRYMKDKEDITGYKYEPWHIRYLGVDVATEVYESGLCLEEYLGIDSVYQD